MEVPLSVALSFQNRFSQFLYFVGFESNFLFASLCGFMNKVIQQINSRKKKKKTNKTEQWWSSIAILQFQYSVTSLFQVGISLKDRKASKFEQ